MHVKGYAAPETKAAVERARLLIEQAQAHGEPPDDPLLLFSVLYGGVIAELSRELPSDIFQIHSRDYRNPSQLPRGAALVVGSGASGTQIAEELHRSGRKVILAVGRFHKTPRRYRGRDFYWWFDKLGYWHIRPL